MANSYFKVLGYQVNLRKISGKIPGFNFSRIISLQTNPKQHGHYAQGTVYFGADMAPPIGKFKKTGPLATNTFHVTLPMDYFDDFYAILRSEKPLFLNYTAPITYEDAAVGATGDITGIILQTENEPIGEGVDTSG